MVNISRLVDIFAGWIVVLQELWDVLNRSLTSFIFPYGSSSFFINLVTDFLDSSSLGDYTLLEFLLGAGLLFYLAYQFITWVLNIIT